MSPSARRVEPEILDALAPDDPRAIRSRNELRRINRIMAQAGVMARALARAAPPGGVRSILDLGSGDGTFMLAAARSLSRRWAGVSVTLLDRQTSASAATLAAFASLGWRARSVQADAVAFLRSGERFGAATANLFLHHFDDPALASLLAAISGAADLLVACEPRRAALPLAASRLVWVFGSGPVTRHDAAASVRAGFTGDELSRLWPKAPGWRCEEGRAALFTHRFVARREEARP
ncbi:MAG: methyltransferase domain-containing protein [Bauldia sp.]|nr:methyltransferase domain-containing protein [Bauldia sp.]